METIYDLGNKMVDALSKEKVMAGYDRQKKHKVDVRLMEI